jgi:hypothetical protein
MIVNDRSETGLKHLHRGALSFRPDRGTANLFALSFRHDT